MKDIKENYLILGCGKTGLSCAQFLLDRGHDVEMFDTREAPPLLTDIQGLISHEKVFLKEWDAALIQDKDVIVVSPGISQDEPILQQANHLGIHVIGDIELFYQHANAPIVAITGSNGKSTVTMMLAKMAMAAKMNIAVGGNLGTPALELISEVDFYILEISSFHLEYVSDFSPAISTVLNISPDHLDRYKNLSEYRGVKERVYRGDGIRIINKDFSDFLPYINKKSHCFSARKPKDNEYGLEEKSDGLWLVRGKQEILHADEILLNGKHNMLNAAAAFALGESMGISLDTMQCVARQFQGLPHRVECVIEKNSISWIDDSKGTNVGAAEAAVMGVQGNVVLIAGGVAKEKDFSLLVNAMRTKGRVVILLGQDAPLLGKAFCGVVPIVYAEDMMDAVTIAARYAEAGDSVLLSPACASFDMYSNYIERGNAYKAAVLHQLNQSMAAA